MDHINDESENHPFRSARTHVIVFSILLWIMIPVLCVQFSMHALFAGMGDGAGIPDKIARQWDIYFGVATIAGIAISVYCLVMTRRWYQRLFVLVALIFYTAPLYVFPNSTIKMMMWALKHPSP